MNTLIAGGRLPGRPSHAATLLALAVLLGGCADPLPVSSFATIGPQAGPQFDPVRFFTGSTKSWGVLENRSGEPTGIVRTEGTGVADGDGVHFVQRVVLDDGTPQVRDWHMRRVGPGRYEATANDMVGTARGEAAGRAFHWSWTLATRPGDPLRNVLMDQWMYGMDDGAMVNHTTISKLGVTVAQVTEQFRREP